MLLLALVMLMLACAALPFVALADVASRDGDGPVR